jgi:hypothetical protein
LLTVIALVLLLEGAGTRKPVAGAG